MGELNPNNVPEELRDLLPLADKFGLACCVRRDELAVEMSDEERYGLSKTLRGRHPAIYRWLNAHDANRRFTREAAAFMWLYVFEMEYCGGPGAPSKGTDIDAWYDAYLLRRYDTTEI
jgi:hypothetical protein